MTSPSRKNRRTTAPNGATKRNRRPTAAALAVAALLLTSAATAQAGENSAGLRWKSRSGAGAPQPATLPVRRAVPLQPTRGSVVVDRTVIVDEAVRGVQAVEPIDDPFGDKLGDKPQEKTGDKPGDQPHEKTGEKNNAEKPKRALPAPAPLKLTEPVLPKLDDDAKLAAPTPSKPANDDFVGDVHEDCTAIRNSLKPLGAIDPKALLPLPPGEFPPNCFVMYPDVNNVDHRTNDGWCETTYTWKASGLCHKPLYFEEPALERYGHTTGPFTQPIVSGAHFFGSVFVLPYKMGLEAPGECKYALGYYRPGSCAPYIIPGVPISARGIAAQTAVTLGLIYALP